MKRNQLLVGMVITFALIVAVLMVPVYYSSIVPNSSLFQRKVEDYGNGVYYFSNSLPQLRYELSNFINEHPRLELVAFACEGHGCLAVFRKNESDKIRE